jgi:hypothetical protein
MIILLARPNFVILIPARAGASRIRVMLYPLFWLHPSSDLLIFGVFRDLV